MGIRKIRHSDFKAIAELLDQLGYPATLVAFHRRLKNLDSRHDLILVAVENRRVVGFVSLHLIPMLHEDGLLVRVTALVVDELFRDKGIGGKLVRAAEACARKKGAVKSEITSREGRQGAHRFYKRLGYQEYRKRFLKRFGTK